MKAQRGSRGRSNKTKGRSLEVMAHLKRSIIQVKAVTNCLAYALIIAIAKITKGLNYQAYRHGR
jgi:ribosome-associated translation inhibitor RaiA